MDMLHPSHIGTVAVQPTVFQSQLPTERIGDGGAFTKETHIVDSELAMQ